MIVFYLVRGRYDRKQAPAARWAQHRADLVHAAADEIVSNGPHVVTVDRIVRRAGRGRNTFYAHFRDIDQVLRAVESSVLSRVAALTENVLISEMALRDRLTAIVRSWVEVGNANPTAFRAMLLVGAPPGKMTSRSRELLRQELARALGDAYEDGEISETISEVQIAALTGMWDGALRAQVENEVTGELLVDTLVHMTMSALDLSAAFGR